MRSLVMSSSPTGRPQLLMVTMPPTRKDYGPCHAAASCVGQDPRHFQRSAVSTSLPMTHLCWCSAAKAVPCSWPPCTSLLEMLPGCCVTLIAFQRRVNAARMPLGSHTGRHMQHQRAQDSPVHVTASFPGPPHEEACSHQAHKKGLTTVQPCQWCRHRPDGIPCRSNGIRHRPSLSHWPWC
jgi:hypothetical protein